MKQIDTTLRFFFNEIEMQTKSKFTQQNVWNRAKSLFWLKIMSLSLVVGVGVGGEVGLDGLEEVRGLLFAFLDMLLLDLVLAFCVVLAAALHYGPTIRRGHKFGLVADLLDNVA